MPKCNKGCDTEIYFDWAIRSPSGKQIPLELDTGLPHDCSKKNQTQEKFIGEEIMDLENTERDRLGYNN